MSERKTTIVNDPLGNAIKIPTTTEPGDWKAVCQGCGKICGGTFGVAPSDDDRRYVCCPVCDHEGEPNIIWK